MNKICDFRITPSSSPVTEERPLENSSSTGCYNPFAAFYGVATPIYRLATAIFCRPQVAVPLNKTQFLKEFLRYQSRFADFSALSNAVLSQKNNPFTSSEELAEEWRSLEVGFLDEKAKTTRSFLELKNAVLMPALNNPFQVFQNSEAELLARLDALTSNFGYQARMPECAHDIAPADFDADKDLKEVLEKNEGTGVYKINSQKNLEQLLTKVPAAFISAGLNPEQVNELKEFEQALQANPAQVDLLEGRKALIKIQTENYQKLKDDLANEGFKIIEVDGNYGGEEKSFMVILDHKLKVGSFKAFLNNDKVKKLIALGKNYQQDSVLFQWGAAQFYYYPDKDLISFGEGYDVYDICTKADEEKLPERAKNYYSDIIKDENGKLRFQLFLEFEYKFTPNLFNILCDYARTQFFKDFYLSQSIDLDKTNKIMPQAVVIMRGVDNYNEAGIRLYNELKRKNVPVSIFGSDAHLHALEREGVKGFSNLLPQMRSRNKKAFDELLYKSESRVVIFADMNKMESYFEPYIDEAKEAGIDNIFIWNVQDRNMEKPLQRCLFSHTVRHKMQIENIKTTELTKHKIPQIIDTKEEDNLPKMLNSILAV